MKLYLDDSLQRQADVPALADGESWTRLLQAPPSGTVTLEVFFYGGPGGPIDDRWVQIEMAACPLPPTAPTFTTTVEGCAGDDEGATIEVTVTNTPGGPEYGFQINYSIPGSMQGDDYWAALVNVNPADGQQAVAVLEFDEIEVDGVIRQQDPGGYPVWLSWQVDIPGDPFPQRLETEHVEVTVPACAPYLSAPVRMATFNASLNRAAEGELVSDLSTSDDPQAAAVAEIIQRTRPDVVLLNEFDFDTSGEAVELFRTNYLAVSQHGADPIDYPYWFTAPVNTGIPVRVRLGQ